MKDASAAWLPCVWWLLTFLPPGLWEELFLVLFTLRGEYFFLRTKAWWTCFDIGMVVRYESFVGYINGRGGHGWDRNNNVVLFLYPFL